MKLKLQNLSVRALRLCILPWIFGAAELSMMADDQTSTITPEEVRELIPELTARVRQSLVVVRAAARSADHAGLGTGFAIGDEGLIVTARHVIGDGRDIHVELNDGRVLQAEEVYASSSRLDLAVIRIPENSVPSLQLGAADLITQGRHVIAMGHPRGFRHSVVSGVISGRRELDGISMVQLAMPIEPGNSGGPVLDLTGRVLGIVTMKSTASDNLGFALPVDLLHGLLEQPNPIPIDRWRTIGVLDPEQWTVLFGANWRQRAGRVTASGMGSSFGGRSLCLSTTSITEFPIELQVSVRLQDERGAAGLVFHADGGDRHYGFYPSNGNLRLTRFDGPDVQSWTILHNMAHPEYRTGAWNTLKVRIEADRFTCFVNGTAVVESTDNGLSGDRVGLASFRGTEAEFRGFLWGDRLPDDSPDETVAAALKAAAEHVLPSVPADGHAITALLPHHRFTTRFFHAEADRLELQALQLRRLAAAVHQRTIRNQLLKLLAASDNPEQLASPSRPDLLHAALLVAKLDNEEIDLDAYLQRVDQMTKEIRSQLPDDADDLQRLQLLDEYLFAQHGFRGSRFEYYTRSNSYLNEVLDDREGLPITLSIIYIVLAQKLDLNVTGVGLPGHFVVQYHPSDQPQDRILIDPFEGGKRLSMDEATSRLRESGYPVLPRYFEAQSVRQIIQRMLLNLLSLAESAREDEDVLKYLEILADIAPDEPEYRAKRLEMRARTGRLEEAISDVDWFIDQSPAGTDQQRILELKTTLQDQLKKQSGQLSSRKNAD